MSASRTAALFLIFIGAAAAAPKLRLTHTAIGPYSIARGHNGSPQYVDVWNAGDGQFSLSLSSSAAWAQPSLGAPRACAAPAGSCLPIEVALPTANLEPGTHTATITVSDPAAIDAPQTILVIVQIGGAVPDGIELYAAPNGSASAKMTTNQQVRWNLNTQDGRPWLAIATYGNGSYRFGFTHIVTATPKEGMGPGEYSGSITISNSEFAADNKRVNVTLHVTTEPIAEASSPKISFRIAEGTPKQSQSLYLHNRGEGSLSVSGVAVATTSGGEWLSYSQEESLVTADPAGLGPGLYRGSLAFESNAVNGAVTVPVELEVVGQGAPLAFYRGTVNAATFLPEDPVAPGQIMALFGEQLAYDGPKSAESIPLPKELGGTRVLVNGEPAPLFYVSYGQINFQMPFETPLGEVHVQVERDGWTGNTVAVQLSERGPRILPFGEYGVIQNASRDYTLPMPPAPGIPAQRARPGDILVVYGFGFGPVAPEIRTAEAGPSKEPLARLTAPVTAFFGPRSVFGDPPSSTPDYAGLAPELVGVYQINVRIPDDAPRGDRVPLWMRVGDQVTREVLVAIE
ncbi:MAG: hypothetical protein ACM3S5_04615 [Rhodospirillales bacterium]